ncbi:MAG: protein translocase subunit SecD [Lachnospiraceae bacterium]|nr:protein translocase subunit SecD [Lachnospiraceae bacterium]
MKDKKRGAVALILILLIIGGLGYATVVGIGENHKLSAKNIILGLDLNGGVSISYEAVGDTPTETEMKDTISKMQSRAEVYSTEASVVQEGDNRIVIDIPGVDDAEAVLATLGKEGELVFVNSKNVTEDKETHELTYKDEDIICTGADVVSAVGEAHQSETGAREYVVSLEFNDEGTERFGEASTEAYNNNKESISIIYDHELLSAPSVQSPITDGKCQITGGYKSVAEAEELASGIRIGALPIELKEVESKVVDAQLGQGALETGVKAGIAGFAIVVLFMIILYRIPGIASGISLCMFLGLYLCAINGLNVTLTLPGIAGVILNIGMAVDANVVIFSRIKEELGDGKTVQTAIKNGFSKALSAVLDGNITTLIAALVLYLRGSGTVKGFAITLAIGIVLSMFSSIVITRLLLSALCVLGVNDVKFFGQVKKHYNFDFVSKKNMFFGISGAFIVACIVALIVNVNSIGGILNFGLEFQGGTSYKITFNDDTEINDELKKDIEDLFRSEGEAKQVVISKVRDSNTLQVQTPVMTEEQRNAVTDKVMSDYKITTDAISYDSISGSISNEMRQNAIIAVILASILMLIYIAFRFKDFVFAGSAVLALLHDIIIVLLLYAVSRIAVGNTFIAVMLTILGYSINSTIVIFDRVRENLKGQRRSKENLKIIVNKSINDTLSRSINTNLTTLFTLLALVVLGVSTIREFAIPLTVGVIAGTYSSIFVTAPLWYTIKCATLGKKAESAPASESNTKSKKTSDSEATTEESAPEKKITANPTKQAVAAKKKGNGQGGKKKKKGQR